MSTIVSHAPPTKSQKKRMKRNKAKTRPGSEQTEAKTVEQLDPLNAHDALRIGLHKLGFKLALIDKAMEDMWNLDLDYSDINAVAAYISAGGKVVPVACDGLTNTASFGTFTSNTEAMTEEVSMGDDSPSLVVELKSRVKQQGLRLNGSNEEEASTVSTRSISATAITIQQSHEQKSPGIPQTVRKTQQPLVKAANSAEVVENGTKEVMQRGPPSLRTKLHVVANNKNLIDAIVALTEWIVKAATPLEVKQLCDTSEPSALRTVIRRAIIAPGTRNVSGQLLDLIGSILRMAGIPSTKISSSARALMTTLSKAKSAIEVDEKLKEDIADFVSVMVTTDIAKSVEKLTTASIGDGRTTKQLEADIAALKSSIPVSIGKGVGSIVAKRDMMKDLAQKHSKILKMKMIPKNGDIGTYVPDEVSKDEMIAGVLGEKYDLITNSEATYQDLKSRQDVSADSLSKKEVVFSKVESLKGKQIEISEQIKALELEMKRLNADLNCVNQELEQEEMALSQIDDSLSSEAKEFELLMKEALHNMRVNESVSDVVESLQDFQKENTKLVSNELSSIQSKMQQNDPPEELPAHMKAYISSMKEYFDSELELVSFLQRRATKLRDGFPRMEMEIEECRCLGMTTNVSEMEKKLSELQQNIVDDETIITALQKEAIEMKEKLTSLLSEYRSTGADSGAYESYMKDMEMTIGAII